MSMQQFCLRWNNHQPNFISVFTNLLNSQSLVDVTLAAEGRHIQAHRVVLSACSSYFQTLFSVNPHQHPIVILKDVKYNDLKIIVNFMYYGEVNVSQEQLPSIIKTAENLKIKGLTDMPENNLLLSKSSSSQSSDKPELLSLESNWNIEGRPISPASKRKRLRKSSTGSTENTSEEIPNEISLTSSPVMTKHEPMLVTPESESIRSESSLRASGHEQSTESEPRDGSQESTDDAPSHLGSQDSTTSEGMGSSIHEPSTSHPPQVSAQGLQWSLVEHSYPPPPPPRAHLQYATPTFPGHQMLPMSMSPPCQILASYTMSSNTSHSVLGGVSSPSSNSCDSPSASECGSVCRGAIGGGGTSGSTSGTPTRRKRTTNPQSDENFMRALDAVRTGGIGFCKAARMYGVNNRTLWLEYKKRGYPVNRQSVKSRKLETITSSSPQPSTSGTLPPPPPPPPPISSSSFSPPPEYILPHQGLIRHRYPEHAAAAAAAAAQLHSNFNPI